MDGGAAPLTVAAASWKVGSRVRDSDPTIANRIARLSNPCSLPSISLSCRTSRGPVARTVSWDDAHVGRPLRCITRAIASAGSTAVDAERKPRRGQRRRAGELREPVAIQSRVQSPLRRAASTRCHTHAARSGRWRLQCARGGRVGVSGPLTSRSRNGCTALRDSPRETLANLSVTGHLSGFSDQPGSKIAQTIEEGATSSTR